ncbi:hypothetical protein T01_12379 [Trichinella spiralis]|uniref:Uncharacterized protein n=1 Tax=Trichinella spiralis TaxID=6334 RepID=A0A0V1AWJ4_TRISP|nr:hypothetical protein T01_12379 [Trichinella spiralis]
MINVVPINHIMDHCHSRAVYCLKWFKKWFIANNRSKFIYKQWEQIYISVGKSVIDHLGYRWYIQGCTNDINSILPSMKLWRILANKTSINKAAVLSVNLYPQTIICNFEITLIPLC